MRYNRTKAILGLMALASSMIVSCKKNETVAVTGVTLNETSLVLKSGETAFLRASAEPRTATNRDVEWSTDNAAVASVSPIGKVTAVEPGEAIIKARTIDGGFTASCNVTVTSEAVEITSVSLDYKQLVMTKGSSSVLKAAVMPDNAPDKTLVWSSDKESVAKVDQSGKVSAVEIGSAVITVSTKAGHKTASCAVTVIAAIVPVQSVSLDREEASLKVDGTLKLIAHVLPEDATDKTVKWESSATDVATVREDGLVTAIGEGSAEITVTTVDGSRKAVCRITVTPKPEGLTIGDADEIEYKL